MTKILLKYKNDTLHTVDKHRWAFMTTSCRGFVVERRHITALSLKSHQLADRVGGRAAEVGHVAAVL